MNIRSILFALSVFFLLTACESVEGEGGTSSISGKVFVRDFDNDGELIDEFYAGEWAVYIVYGDDAVYGDKMDTHFDGTYRFSGLYPGNYTIYSYSKCESCPGEVEVVSVNVALERSTALSLDDLVVKD